MIDENIKNSIRELLWHENEIFGSSLAISDIQLCQRNLLIYEWTVRCSISWATKSGQNEIQDLIKDNTDASNQYVDNVLKKADTFIVEKYLEYINKYQVDNIIDWWDFLFEINPYREKYFRNNFHKKFKETLVSKDSRKIMLIWNHDKEKFSNFYKEYFDEVRNFVFQFNETTWQLDIYTHEPLTKRSINMPKFQLIKNFLKENFNISIKNIYWHTHSNVINPQYDWDTLYEISEYENMCIDYKIKNSLL